MLKNVLDILYRWAVRIKYRREMEVKIRHAWGLTCPYCPLAFYTVAETATIARKKAEEQLCSHALSEHPDMT